jgi:hypothetical protein
VGVQMTKTKEMAQLYWTNQQLTQISPRQIGIQRRQCQGKNVRGYRSCLKKNRTKVQKANMMRRRVSQVLWAWSYQLLRLLLQHTVLKLLLPAAVVLTINMPSMAAWVKKDLQLYLLMIQDHNWLIISMGLLPILDKPVIGCTCWWFH